MTFLTIRSSKKCIVTMTIMQEEATAITAMVLRAHLIKPYSNSSNKDVFRGGLYKYTSILRLIMLAPAGLRLFIQLMF